MTAFDKGNIGLKHDHETIGKIVNDSEFRGYMIAQGQERQRQIEELKEEIHDLKMSIERGNKEAISIQLSQGQRITVLELDKARATGFVAGIGIVAGIISSIVIMGIARILGV